MARKSFINHITELAAHNTSNPEARKAVHLTYNKLNGRTVKRKIDPLVIRNKLILAYDHKRDALRSFKFEGIKGMKKEAFWNGFKQASALAHAAELAGLGTLAAPSIQHLRGKPMDEHKKSKYELAGLGILAAPTIAHGIGKLIHK